MMVLISLWVNITSARILVVFVSVISFVPIVITFPIFFSIKCTVIKLGPLARMFYHYKQKYLEFSLRTLDGYEFVDFFRLDILEHSENNSTTELHS